jgi:hypothetical protein
MLKFLGFGLNSVFLGIGMLGGATSGAARNRNSTRRNDMHEQLTGKRIAFLFTDGVELGA